MIGAEIGNTAMAGQLFHVLVGGRLIKCFVTSPVEGRKLCFFPFGSIRKSMQPCDVHGKLRFGSAASSSSLLRLITRSPGCVVT